MTRIMSGLAHNAGADAARDQMQRIVPEQWQAFRREWHQGYDEATKAMDDKRIVVKTDK